MPAAHAQTSDANGLFYLSRAQKAYDSGDYTAALSALDEAFQAGLSKELSARAILLRAQVHERSGSLARALQDYSSALWMDTLPPAERKKAAAGKQRVIAAMGLTPPAPVAAQNNPGGVAQANAGGSNAPAGGESSSGGTFGTIKGWFGSSPPAPPAPTAEVRDPWRPATGPAPAPQAPPAPPPPAAQAQVPAEASASEVLTRPAKAAAVPAPPKTARADRTPAAPAVQMAAIQPVSISAASAANGYLIVFGAVPSEAAGHARAQQIKATLADILVNRDLAIAPGASGGFLIVAGPYKARSSALALCSAMKQRGVPCQVAP
jgi:tetratricopeptide (TPR) repeat protein